MLLNERYPNGILLKQYLPNGVIVVRCGLFYEWNLPKATVSIKCAEYPGTRELGKDVVHFCEWVCYAEYTSIERFQINTVSDCSIFLQHNYHSGTPFCGCFYFGNDSYNDLTNSAELLLN